MAKIGSYSQLYPRWQETLIEEGVPKDMALRWSVLLENRYSNPSGLYEFVMPGLADLCCYSEIEMVEMLDLLAAKGFLAWDPKAHCIFIYKKIRYNYDTLSIGNGCTRGLLKIIANLRHLSLYGLLLEEYDELAPALPAPRERSSQRGNGDTPLIFEARSPEVQPEVETAGEEPQKGAKRGCAGGARAKLTEQDKYLALRRSVATGILRVYDALAPVFREHSRQPRSEKDWAGMRADLKALAKIAQNTRGVLPALVPALRAVFVEGWEELTYYRTGVGRVETISGLSTIWSDGTMKAAAIVSRWESASASRRGGVSAGEEDEAELTRLIAEYRAMKDTPGVSREELAAKVNRIKELQGVQRA